jgi:hypothetical protein
LQAKIFHCFRTGSLGLPQLRSFVHLDRTSVHV